MDPRIIRQYLGNLYPGRQPLNYLIESSRALGSLPPNITYNGLLYTFNPRLNAFVNQFGHQISISQAAAFATSSAISAEMDILTSASDSGPVGATIVTIPPIDGFRTNPNPPNPDKETLNEWDSPSFISLISGYYVYRSINSAPYVKIATITNPATLLYIDSGLTTGVVYNYYVTAFNDTVESPPSSIGEVELQEIPYTPVGITAPSGLSASLITSSSMQLNWIDNSTNELGFYIYKSLDGITYNITQGANAGETSANIKGLSADTTYYFKVNAYATGSTSAFSNTISQTTYPSTLTAPTLLSVYSYVPGITNYLRYTEGFTTTVSLANGGWTAASTPANSTTVSIDNSVTAPDGSSGAALLTVNNPTVIGGIHSIVSQSGITASDYWTGSVWLRGKTATCGGINVVVRAGGSQTVIPSTLKILSGPGTVIPSSVGEAHWNGVTGLSKTEWTRVAWNNNSPWGTTGFGGTFTDVLLRLTVNYYNGVSPSAVTGDSIYVWGAQFERNSYATSYLAATGGSFSSRDFQGLTSQINLYWKDNSNNESGFYVERSTDDVAYTGITTLGVDTTVYNDYGLSAGTTYYYKVSAVGFGITSSAAGPTYTSTYYNIPAAPTNLIFTGRTTSTFGLSWTDNSTNEFGFVIDSSTGGVTYSQLTTVSANTTTYNVSGLCSGSTYFFRVAAYNPGGTSSFAGPTSWATIPLPPSTPEFTNFVIGGTSQINLYWSDVSNETGYEIYRSTDGSNYSSITTLGANVTAYVNVGLSSGTTYYYKMNAFNSGGTSNFSGVTYGRTLIAVPNAPTNLTLLSATTDRIDIGWTDNSTDELGFYLYSSTNGVNYTLLSTETAGTTSYGDKGLPTGTTYYYKVNAYNDGGTSGFAGPLAASTTTNAPPSAPTGFTAINIQYDSVTLQWTDTSTNEDGFNIYYRQI